MTIEQYDSLSQNLCCLSGLILILFASVFSYKENPDVRDSYLVRKMEYINNFVAVLITCRKMSLLYLIASQGPLLLPIFQIIMF